jgi:chromosome partitioning protein
MKQIVSVVNLKGGVGKTTSSVNLAACWGELGKKVLLIDIDPQGSATISLGISNEGRELLQALHTTSALPVIDTEFKNLQVVPSGPELISARQVFTDAFDTERLTQCLMRTPGDWDVVIMDCPPGLDILTINSLMASEYVIIPVETSFLGLNGLKQMVRTIEDIKFKNPNLEIAAVIPCRAQRRRRIHWEIMKKLEEMFPGKVSPIIRENVSLAEAPGKGKPVIYTSSLSNGADDYRLVALWLGEKLDLDLETETNPSSEGLIPQIA